MSRDLHYTVEPISGWPGERTAAWKRRRAPFKANWTRTLALLERELRHLGAQTIKLRLDVSTSDLRQDGQLRANARPRDPGVLVEFIATRLTGRPVLVYRCDTFGFWQDNVDAIARGLEALRMVDRYGVTPAGEQYTGFKALPSFTQPTMGVTSAAEIVAAYSDISATEIATDASKAKAALRIAIHRTHPDKNNGERAYHDRVDAARSVLTSHFGVTL